MDNAMPDPREPFSAAARTSDPDYEGVLRPVGPDWRLAVNMDGTRYLLQQRGFAEGCEIWVAPPGPPPRSLSKLHERFGSKVRGLARACKGLPDNPAEAAPDFHARRAEMIGRFHANDYRRHDYGRVISRRGSLRLVVDPTGAEYRLQWIPSGKLLAGPCDDWKSICITPKASEVRAYVRERVYDASDTSGLAKTEVEAFADELVAELPEHAKDGQWPDLPQRPA
ncbi:hypothetical protein [uncultured Jannaschia sp.]|uniref:hypothetical protein n=1 Tax=uncultured Jannaschia sp. TaxID=293347 RepID=UPI002612BFBA|nr:hypothetical protein [uncultured Jannaschia sp.]